MSRVGSPVITEVNILEETHRKIEGDFIRMCLPNGKGIDIKYNEQEECVEVVGKERLTIFPMAGNVIHINSKSFREK